MTSDNFRLLAIATLIFAACSTVLSPTYANQQDPNGTTKQQTRQSISVAIRRDVQPYVTNHGSAGFEIELVETIFNQTSYIPSFIQMPRVRMLQTFKAGGTDGLLTSNVTLSGKGCLTDWYIQHQNVGVTLAARDTTISGLEDIADLSIITFDGARSFLGPVFAAETKKSPRYMESPDQKIHVSLLYYGYFDVAIGDEWILKMAQVDHKRKLGTYKPLTIHRILPTTLYGARFHDQAVCDAFNSGLRAIRASGQYETIASKHLSRISAHIADYEKELASASKAAPINR